MFKRRAFWGGVFFLLAAAGCIASASAKPVRLPDADTQKINAEVKAAMRRFRVPGAAVMIVRHGHVAFVGAYGLRDLARRLPVQDDTFFEIGSITKQFTAASILQLQDAGKLQIDRPLSDYLPDAPHAKAVTLRQLLTLTSGLHDYLDIPPSQMDRLVSRPISYRDLIARVAPLPLGFAPGSRWSYSNTDYLLLGKVVEAVSGEPYRDYLQHHIFGPLHMTDTHTSGDEGSLPRMAVGYRQADGKLEVAPHIDPSWGGAAGFLVTTLRDLAIWDAALRGGRVVSQASYRQMTTPIMTTQNGSADYGFGLFVDSVYGQPRIGHTGGSLAFTAADEYFPRQDVRIVAFTNLGNEAPEAGEMLTNIVFADLYPEIAAAARRASPGENPTITLTVHDAFRELQTGRGYVRFNAHNRDKLAGAVGTNFVAALGPYGPPTAETFKGIHHDANKTWYNYVIQFGPGVSLPFAVTIDHDGKVAGISVG